MASPALPVHKRQQPIWVELDRYGSGRSQGVTLRDRYGAGRLLGVTAVTVTYHRTHPGGVAQGQSKRLIIAESVVRVHPPLLTSGGNRGLNPAPFPTETDMGGFSYVRAVLSTL